MENNKRKLSDAAQVAKLIKADLKKMGLACRVSSSNFAGGNAVDVYLEDICPESMEKLQARFAKYEYGKFDGMTDCYEYSNVRKDIPQTKFLFIHNNKSAKMKVFLAAYIEKFCGVKNDEECFNKYDRWMDQLIHQTFCDAHFWKVNGAEFADKQPKITPEFQQVVVNSATIKQEVKYGSVSC